LSAVFAIAECRAKDLRQKVVWHAGIRCTQRHSFFS
jgi:hypothetical protein